MPFTTETLTRRCGRDINQDYCDFASNANEIFCWALADGLGGHTGGETASRLAVETIIRSFHSDFALSLETLNEHLMAAQKQLLIEQKKNRRLANMRSTIVVLMSDGSHALWGHVGDSRLYWFRHGRVAGRTMDHSVSQVKADSGDITEGQIRHDEDRSFLLRSLGGEEMVCPTLSDGLYSLEPGDVFLLCTDGFWENVLEIEMEVELLKSSEPGQWLERLESRLLDRVTPNCDNYSAIAVFWKVS